MFAQPSHLPDQQLIKLLDQATQLVSTGELADADALLMRILAVRTGEPGALHLLGTIRLLQERLGDAEILFRRSLAANPKQSHVLNNLGHVLRRQNRHEEALEAFRQAIQLNPQSAEAYFGLATVLHEANAFEEATHAYRAALHINPALVQVKICLGGALTDLGRYAEAAKVLQSAATETQNPVFLAAIEHNLGIAQSKQGNNEAAIAHFDCALSFAPNPGVEHSRGNALHQLGREDEAVASLTRAVAANPFNLAAHRDLNQILYRLRRDDEFLKSYDEASARAPGAIQFPLAKASFLLKQEKCEEALELYEQAHRVAPQNIEALGGMAAARFFLKKYEGALTAFQTALGLYPNEPSLNNGLAATFLVLQEPEKAAMMAERTLSIAPHDQTSLAILGSAWRLQNDAREYELNGYENLIRVFDLEPPQGYSDMAAFNRDLNAYFDTLHPDAREYVDQSLRHGTQTVGDIFNAGHELADRLKVRIEEAVARYIAELPADASHPLSSRRTNGFRFTGSWSSRLRDCGYHTNHLHPNGWISSAYYVALPETADKAGWIKFGEPSYDIGLAEPVRRAIQPQPGRLVLFPSYMWHGTVPFRSAQTRTTIAFDAVPR